MQGNSKGAVVARKSSKVNVSNEIKLDPKNPIPFELSGTSFSFFEQSHQYIPFLGNNDDFFNILQEARLLSPTQNACINTRKTYCLAGGITIKDLPKGKTLKKHNPELYEFMKCVNNRDESLNSIIGDILESFDTYGNAFIEIVKGKVAGKPFVYVYVWNTPECRLAQPKDENLPAKYVLKSQRFLKQGIFKFTSDDVTKLPLLSKRKIKDGWKSDEKGTKRIVIHLKRKMSGYSHYGMPESIACLTHQILEYRGARYNLDLFDNNLNQGGIMVIKGNMSQKEATEKARLVHNQHAGPGKAGRWVFIATEGGIEGSEAHPFDTQKEGSYIELDKSLENKILVQNRWHKVLAGLDDGSALGKGSGYLKTIYDIALKTVIRPQQEMIMENFLMPFFEIVDEHMGTKFSELDLIFHNATPASFIQMLKNPDAAVTRNEVRSELGLSEDSTSAGNEYMSQGKSQKSEPKSEDK